MVSGGMACIKYLTFLFNLLFAITGIVFIAIGTVILVVYHDYNNFMESFFFTAPILMIVIGVIVFIVSFLGCCGAVKENHCMIVTFSVLLLIIFVLEFGSGMIGFVLNKEVRALIKHRLNATMEEYSTNNDIRKSWDIMQHDLECCGMVGPTDWAHVGFPENTVPNSCCKEVPEGSKCDSNSIHIHLNGCLSNLQAAVEYNTLTLCSIGIGIATIQLLGVVFACCLARSIRREYETV